MIVSTTLFTQTTSVTASKFQQVWALFGNEYFKVKKYGYREPVKIKFDSTDSTEAYNLLNTNSLLIAKGSKSLSILVQQFENGITVFDLRMTEKTFDDALFNTLTAFIKNFDSIIPIVYGRCCDENEFNWKHKVPVGRSYGWKGVSIQDFFDYVPGIYWMNVFGSELISAFTPELINSLNVTFTKCTNGLIFHLKQFPSSSNLKNRLVEEYEIMETLGINHFFDRITPENTPNHHKSFKTYLNSIDAKRYN